MFYGNDVPCRFLDSLVYYPEATASEFLKNLVVAGNGLVRHFVNCCGVTCPREIERESVTAQYSYRRIEKARETRQEETSTINRLRLDIGANDSNGQGYLRFCDLVVNNECVT